MDTSVYAERRESGQTPSAVVSDFHARLQARVLKHPFLVRCSEGSATLDELHRFLVQHGKYSSYFTRYLCAVISQLEDGNDVLALAENLAEELGYGLDSRIPHSKIYASVLERYGLSNKSHPTYPETQKLIDTMFALCRRPGVISGLGALYLGAESIVPTTYECIMKGFRAHAVPESTLEFFAIHIGCDDDHAETMRIIIERLLADMRADEMGLLQTVLNAGEVAIDARLCFFDGLSRSSQ